MTVSPEFRRIPIASVPNLRDLGGIDVAGGTVRPGILFRSTALARLTSQDLPAFETLGIATVYDFRTAGERADGPEHPGSARSIPLDVLADSKEDVAASVGSLLTDPSAIAATLGGGKAEAQMIDSYRNFVNLPSAIASYRAFVLDLIDPTREGGALFHCTTGKDRTGWAAALILLALGASLDDVRTDYLATNNELAPLVSPIYEAVGEARDLVAPILEVRPEYLDAALEEVTTRYGSIEGYWREGLGLTAENLEALRALLVLPAQS